MEMKVYFGRLFKSFRKCRAGATAIEYGLIAALIALAIIPGVKLLSTRMDKNVDCATNVVKGHFRDDGIGPCAPFETGGNLSPL